MLVNQKNVMSNRKHGAHMVPSIYFTWHIYVLKVIIVLVVRYYLLLLLLISIYNYYNY